MEVGGFRREADIVSDSMKDFIASAFDQTLNIGQTMYVLLGVPFQ